MRKLRHREVRYIAQGHTAGRGFSWCFSPLVLFGQQTYVSSRVKILYVSEEGQEANEGMGGREAWYP